MSNAVASADPLEVETFLQMLRGEPGTWNEDGHLRGMVPPVGELMAALAVGWTPFKLRQLKRDPAFLVLIKEARELLVESVESIVYRNAFRGNQRALEMVLYSQAADRGWHPPTQRHEIRQTGRIDVTVVASVKEAVRERLAMGGAVAELQNAGPIEEAEIVEDD